MQPQTFRSGIEVVLDSWNEIGRKLTAMAEDFPEDKYDFKPTPAQRSFAEQLLHAAGSCYYFTNPAMGQKPPAAEDPKREQYKTKADIVAFVKKSFADGATAIQSKGENGLMTEVVITLSRKRALSTLHTASSSIAENTTASLLCTTASQVLCRQSRGPRNKAQETRYPVLIARRLREWAGILVLGNFSSKRTWLGCCLSGLSTHRVPFEACSAD